MAAVLGLFPTVWQSGMEMCRPAGVVGHWEHRPCVEGWYLQLLKLLPSGDLGLDGQMFSFFKTSSQSTF